MSKAIELTEEEYKELAEQNAKQEYLLFQGDDLVESLYDTFQDLTTARIEIMRLKKLLKRNGIDFEVKETKE